MIFFIKCYSLSQRKILNISIPYTTFLVLIQEEIKDSTLILDYQKRRRNNYEPPLKGSSEFSNQDYFK